MILRGVRWGRCPWVVRPVETGQRYHHDGGWAACRPSKAYTKYSLIGARSKLVPRVLRGSEQNAVWPEPAANDPMAPISRGPPSESTVECCEQVLTLG